MHFFCVLIANVIIPLHTEGYEVSAFRLLRGPTQPLPTNSRPSTSIIRLEMERRTSSAKHSHFVIHSSTRSRHSISLLSSLGLNVVYGMEQGCFFARKRASQTSFSWALTHTHFWTLLCAMMVLPDGDNPSNRKD